MAIEITGGCCNCGQLCSTGYDHPVPANPMVVCSTKCAQEYNIKVRRNKLNRILRENRKSNFWKSVKKFLPLSL